MAEKRRKLVGYGFKWQIDLENIEVKTTVIQVQKKLNSILSEEENIAFLYSSIHSNIAMHTKDNPSCTFNTTAHHHLILALVAIGQVQQVVHQVVAVVMPNNH